MGKTVNWEKVSVYFSVVVGFMTCIIYIADIKQRVTALEVKIDHQGATLMRMEMDDTKERVTRLEVKVDHLKEKI